MGTARWSSRLRSTHCTADLCIPSYPVEATTIGATATKLLIFTARTSVCFRLLPKRITLQRQGGGHVYACAHGLDKTVQRVGRCIARGEIALEERHRYGWHYTHFIEL